MRCARTAAGTTARDAATTAAAQVAEDPGGPHPRGRGCAVEASSNTDSATDCVGGFRPHHVIIDCVVSNVFPNP